MTDQLRLTPEQQACLTLERDLQEVGALLSPGLQWRITGALHRLKKALGLSTRYVALVGRSAPATITAIDGADGLRGYATEVDDGN